MEPAHDIGGDLTRRDRRKLEVRNRILDAAMALFDQRGVGATKVAEICERADVAHKTFFNHFPSKQHLLSEIARHALDLLLADIEDARAQPGATADRLRFFFERIADNAEAAGPMHRELLTEIIHVAHEAGTEPEQARKLHAAFGALVRDGIAAGDLSGRHDPDTLTEMILGAFYVLMFNWANLDHYPLREHAVAAAGFLGESLSAAPGPGRGRIRRGRINGRSR
jgi:AcrR family transcriptional regulator